MFMWIGFRYLLWFQSDMVVIFECVGFYRTFPDKRLKLMAHQFWMGFKWLNSQTHLITQDASYFCHCRFTWEMGRWDYNGRACVKCFWMVIKFEWNVKHLVSLSNIGRFSFHLNYIYMISHSYSPITTLAEVSIDGVWDCIHM